MDTKSHSPFERRKLRELDRIMDVTKALNRGIPAPRLLYARGYSAVFFSLAFFGTPPEWGVGRAICAAAVGFGVLKLLEKVGPGRASWWTSLSTRLWSYEPIDTEALSQLRKRLAANGKEGGRYALLRVVDWANIELDAIKASARRGEPQ